MSLKLTLGSLHSLWNSEPQKHPPLCPKESAVKIAKVPHLSQSYESFRLPHPLGLMVSTPRHETPNPQPQLL